MVKKMAIEKQRYSKGKKMYSQVVASSQFLADDFYTTKITMTEQKWSLMLHF